VLVDKGLVIVGVHTPEFEFEKNIDNVEAGVDSAGLKYLIVQDHLGFFEIRHNYCDVIYCSRIYFHLYRFTRA
jgi:hypothetical protein